MTVLSGGICALNRLPEILDLGEGEKRKSTKEEKTVLWNIKWETSLEGEREGDGRSR